MEPSIRVEVQVTRDEFIEACRAQIRSPAERRHRQQWMKVRYAAVAAMTAAFLALAVADAAGRIVAGLLALFGAVVVGLTVPGPGSIQRAWEEYESNAQPAEWEFGPDWVRMASPHVDARYRWEAFRQFRSYGGVYLLYRGAQPFVLPKRCFSSEQRVAVQQLAQARLGPWASGFPVRPVPTGQTSRSNT